MHHTVLYHANCPDGFAAAWAAWKVLGDDARYLPVRYGEPPPEFPPGGRVFVLDFSYPRATLLDLADRSESVVVLDHHKSARLELEGLSGPGLEVRFDEGHSGAVFAWKHFHPDEPVPKLVVFVEDRDLWQWRLPESRAFSAALNLVPRDFRAWDRLESSLGYGDALDQFLVRGGAVLEAERVMTGRLCARAELVPIGGNLVPCVNSPVLQSEVGEELCARFPEAPFAAVWFAPDRGTRVFSLRSRGGFDVSEVAKRYGGGGHPAAAGFMVKGGCDPFHPDTGFPKGVS